MKLYLTLALTTLGGLCAAGPVAHLNFVSGKARYHAIVVDMASANVAVKTVMAKGGRSAWGMIGKDQPLAAITGTFFAPRQAIPVADVLVDGKLMAVGDRGSALGIDYLGVVNIFDQQFKSPVAWKSYQYGMRGAVRVVSNGKVNPNPKAQKFRDRGIWGRAARTGIGMTKQGKLVLIATKKSVTLSELGRAMVACGVKNGISMDGGSSTCLYYNGKMIVSPRRRLTNLLVITPRSGPPLTQQIVEAPNVQPSTSFARVTPGRP